MGVVHADSLHGHALGEVAHTDIRGRFFGGDVQNQQIVSGANITSPVSSVPEPSTLLLMGTALTGLGGALWRKGLWRSEPA